MLASRPTRARGLKRAVLTLHTRLTLVAPHTGAWIETYAPAHRWTTPPVAPHTGAWIETNLAEPNAHGFGQVAPHTGAWIETPAPVPQPPIISRRAPHGRVD